MSYPTSLDTLTTGIGTDNQPLSNPDHPTQHTNECIAIQALETKVGVDSSAVTTTIDYLLKSTSSSNPGHKHTLSSLSDFNVSSPVTGQSLIYNGSQWANAGGFKFGGTGADGALSITSGTTTIDLGGLSRVVKNYTSISIITTGKLAFTNPAANGTVVILKSQGAVTLTSATSPLIDMVGAGPAGGAGDSQNGSPGQYFLGTINAGVGAIGSGTGGTGASAPLILMTSANVAMQYRDLPWCIGGAGGGGGKGSGNSTNNGGVGGRGSGALFIECAGALNFTGTINATGQAGGNGGNGDGSHGGGGGGGAGGGGSVVILYNSLTANSGTINSGVSNPGSGGTGTSTGGGSGGGGGASSTGVGNTGSSFSSGTSGVAGGASVGAFSLVRQNTEYA